MMRINREKKHPKTSVKNHCANYDTGYNCIGVMIDKELNQYVDSDFCNKPCKIANGDDCKYYDNIVRKIAGF